MPFTPQQQRVIQPTLEAAPGSNLSQSLASPPSLSPATPSKKLFPRCSLNVIDPIDPSKNLGLSISYKNEFRIRRAFHRGITRMKKALNEWANSSAEQKAEKQSSRAAYLRTDSSVLGNPVLCAMFEDVVLHRYAEQEYRRSLLKKNAKRNEGAASISTGASTSASSSNGSNSTSAPESTDTESSNKNSSSSDLQTKLDLLDGNYDKIIQNLSHARQFERPDISESELVDLIRGILATRGAVPVGRMGSLLHEATNNHSLSAMLKEYYGGLKRFLERHQAVFCVGVDHPYNPQVTLVEHGQKSHGEDSPSQQQQQPRRKQSQKQKHHQLDRERSLSANSLAQQQQNLHQSFGGRTMSASNVYANLSGTHPPVGMPNNGLAVWSPVHFQQQHQQLQQQPQLAQGSSYDRTKHQEENSGPFWGAGSDLYATPTGTPVGTPMSRSRATSGVDVTSEEHGSQISGQLLSPVSLNSSSSLNTTNDSGLNDSMRSLDGKSLSNHDGGKKPGRRRVRTRKYRGNSAETYVPPSTAWVPGKSNNGGNTNVANSSRGVSLTSVLAIDCEMVGVGPAGVSSSLARCSLVNSNGEVVYDKFVLPTEKVTDYRTHVSGIRPEDLTEAGGAVDFKQVQREVTHLVKGRILVGHSISADLQILVLNHPKSLIRDTALCKLLCPRRPLPLKQLMKERIGITIQEGEHDSVVDAQAALQLYQIVSHQWENMLKSKRISPLVPNSATSFYDQNQQVTSMGAAGAVPKAQHQQHPIFPHQMVQPPQDQGFANQQHWKRSDAVPIGEHQKNNSHSPQLGSSFGFLGQSMPKAGSAFGILSLPNTPQRK